MCEIGPLSCRFVNKSLARDVFRDDRRSQNSMSTYAFTESERLRASFADRARRMASTPNARRAVVGGLFRVASLALALLAELETRHVSALSSRCTCSVLRLSAQVRFDVGAGFTVPTQAVFVPMLFAVPLSIAAAAGRAGARRSAWPRRCSPDARPRAGC